MDLMSTPLEAGTKIIPITRDYFLWQQLNISLFPDALFFMIVI